MIHLLYLIPGNSHFVDRYIRFLLTRKTEYKKYFTHRHHILPKAQDFFPEFKELAIHSWNYIHLTPREHHIAHRLLHKAFPGTSQTLAFYNMSNEQNRRSSKAYEESRIFHIQRAIEATQCPVRNKRISESLKGKKKAKEHIEKLLGHPVSEATREKLRAANTGKKASEEARQRMSLSRTGKRKQPHSKRARNNIALSKMSYAISTPNGVFSTFADASLKLGVSETVIRNIFRSLDKIPRKKNVDLFGIQYSAGLTWAEYGFSKLSKP